MTDELLPDEVWVRMTADSQGIPYKEFCIVTNKEGAIKYTRADTSQNEGSEALEWFNKCMIILDDHYFCDSDRMTEEEFQDSLLHHKTICRALKLAEAVKKDLANGWVSVPPHRTAKMARAISDHIMVKDDAMYLSEDWYESLIKAAPKSHTAKAVE